MSSKDLERLLEDLIQEQNLIQATLSNPRNKDPGKPYKVLIRPLRIKGQIVFQLSEFIAEKVFHTNVSIDECKSILKERLINEFKQGLFCSKDGDYQILTNKEQRITILKHSPSQIEPKTQVHNRQKQYLLEEGKPLPFLIELGVMNKEGKVYPDKRNKFRQLNRFIEMVDDILPYLDKSKTVNIIDFGCGKSYLTFALYHYLHDSQKLSISITGYDLKADVVQFCQKTAKNLGFTNLNFFVGDISKQSPEEKIHMVITLHACDTATDAALERAVRWDAEVILSVPCCQHELFKQIDSPLLAPILKQGILKERFSAIVTDAARVQLLTILGYSTQILEFIETEHTPKNLLIRAIRSDRVNVKKAKEEYLAFKKALNIFPSLERRFKKELNEF